MLLGGEALDEMTGQRNDVAGAVAQRRHQDGKHVQPVIQVLAEAALARHASQVAVGGADDAHIHLHRPFGADGIDFALLQGAQQLDLHVQAKLADLVQEQGTAVGFLEFAQMLVAGAGERALFVAEQDALDQVFRDGAAIDGDERLSRTRARALDGARDQLLAGAAFAFDQDGDVGLGRARSQAEDLFHLGAGRHQVLEGELVVGLLLQLLDLARKRADLELVADRNGDAFGAGGLDQEIVGAGAHRLHGAVDAAARGQHDHRQVGIGCAQLGQHLQPAHVGHHQVQQHQRDLFAARTVDQVQRRAAAGRGDDLHAAAGDRRFQQSPLHGIVVNDKDGLRHDAEPFVPNGRGF